MGWGLVAWGICRVMAKTAAKIALKTVSLPLVVVVEATDAVVCVYQGDYSGAVMCVASGAVDLYTCGAASALKETVNAASKTASIQAAKSIAKQTTQQMGKAAAKEVSKQLGKELSKNIASGTISSIGQEAFKEASATTVKRGVLVTIGSAIRAPCQQGIKSFVKGVGQFVGKETVQVALAESTKVAANAFVREGVKEAVKEAGKQMGRQAAKQAIKTTAAVEVGKIGLAVGEKTGINKAIINFLYGIFKNVKGG